MNVSKKVIVLGASSNPEKYSFQAVKLLSEKGYDAIPVHPSGIPVYGLTTYKDLTELQGKEIDTISLYVNPDITKKSFDRILAMAPRRIIFNPGTEDAQLMTLFSDNKIIVEQGCTIVMLKTNLF